MNTGTFSLVPFWSILKFHNPFNLLVTQTTLDMHIGLNDFQSPTKTTKPKLESVSSAMWSRKKATREHLQPHDKSTTIICSVCKVALCIYPCFRLYHVQN